MKKIKYILTILGFSLCLSSCDLDTEPTNYVPGSSIYSDIENIEKVLTGAWTYLWEYNTIVSSPGFHTALLASDAMGSDINVRNGYGYIGIYQFTIMHDASQSWVLRVWENAYKTIDNCNSILANIDNVQGDANDIKRVKAQTLALRGYIYHNIGAFYSYAYAKDPNALCAPIYKTPTTAKTEGNPKSSVHDVFERARLDLEEAYTLMSSTYNRSAKWKINKSVICGILARVYLHMNTWDKAAQYAAEAHAGYSWMSKADYLGGFNDVSNSEWMWGQPQTLEQYMIPFSWRDVSTTPGSSYYAFFADPFFKDFFIKEITPTNDTIYDTGDTRFNLFQWDVTRYKGALMYKKFRYRESTIGDYVFMRKAEMVLIEAEALAEDNQLPQAIAALNSLRTARGADTPNLSTLTKDQLVEEILIERRKELFGEGFSLTDIIRRQKPVERREYTTGVSGYGYVPGTTILKQGHTSTKLPDGTSHVANSRYYLFAIPQGELNTNPNI